MNSWHLWVEEKPLGSFHTKINVIKKNLIMKLTTLKLFYYDYVHWQITLYIKFIREKKFPNQTSYYEQCLKEALILRNKIALQIINYFEPKQLTLF